MRVVACSFLIAAACGDNLPGIADELVPASSLFVVAHLDDDMIFMQPQLIRALIRGSSTTVYVTSGDPAGPVHARRTFEAAMTAYEHATGAIDWACGYTWVTDLPVHHCRLVSAGISLVGLDVAEGGRRNELRDGLQHLLEQEVTSLPVMGPHPARVTVDSLVEELAEVISITAPDDLHVLDYAGTHGDDHPGHMISASFGLWAAAKAGYRGPITSHRGYNTDGEPITLSDADYALAMPMLGYFDACYFKTAPCGTQGPPQDGHDRLLRRQYSSTAQVDATAGALERLDMPGACLAAADGVIGFADCADPSVVRLDPEGRLRAGALCLAAGAGNDDPNAIAACDGAMAQSWILDSEGLVWNAVPPTAIIGMQFDHMRCLAGTGAPVCGSRMQPRWRLVR